MSKINWYIYWLIVYGNLLISLGFAFNVNDGKFYHPDGTVTTVTSMDIPKRGISDYPKR